MVPETSTARWLAPCFPSHRLKVSPSMASKPSLTTPSTIMPRIQAVPRSRMETTRVRSGQSLPSVARYSQVKAPASASSIRTHPYEAVAVSPASRREPRGPAAGASARGG